MQRLYISELNDSKIQMFEIELWTQYCEITFILNARKECDTYQSVIDTLKEYESNNLFNYYTLDLKINSKWISNIQNWGDLADSIYQSNLKQKVI